jgi:hypothetical protein
MLGIATIRIVSQPDAESVTETGTRRCRLSVNIVKGVLTRP